MRKLHATFGATVALLFLGFSANHASAVPVYSDVTSECNAAGDCNIVNGNSSFSFHYTPTSTDPIDIHFGNLGEAIGNPGGNFLTDAHDQGLWTDVSVAADWVGECTRSDAGNSCNTETYANGTATSSGVTLTGGSGKNDAAAVFSITTPGFDHLALHLGGQTGAVLLFQWTNPIHEFTIGNIESSPNSDFGGVSWFDAFWPAPDAPPTDTPAPGALWLIGSGLVGLGALARRQRKA